MKRFLPLLAAAFLCPGAVSAGDKKADPAETIAKLIDNLKKKDDPVARLQAAMEIAEFGPAAKDAVPSLVDLLQNGDEDLKLNAALALGKIGKAAVAPVTEILAAKDEDSRFYALWALGWIGPDAVAAAPQIIKLSTTRTPAVLPQGRLRRRPHRAEPATTIPILIKAFQDKDHDVQTAAGEAVSSSAARRPRADQGARGPEDKAASGGLPRRHRPEGEGRRPPSEGAAR